MNVNGNVPMPEIRPEQKGVKIAMIQIQFTPESDADAIAVKALVNEALSDRANVRINFSIIDQHGPQ